MIDIKDNLQNNAIEGKNVSILLKKEAKLLGHIEFCTDEGIIFECVIPYDEIETYNVLSEDIKIETKYNDIIEKYDDINPRQGETIAVCQKNSDLLIGRYVGNDDVSIRIEKKGKIIVIEKDIIEHLYLCGVITSYNILNKSGIINNRYKFNKAMIDSDSNIFKKLGKDNQRGKNMYMCLYEIKMDNNNKPLITSLEDFEEFKDQIDWEQGEITAVPNKSSYFTVEDDIRCYYSSVDDETLINYRKDMDLQNQDVIFRKVFHRGDIEKRKRNFIPKSIIEIKSKYQIGIIKRERITNTITIACGNNEYKYQGEELPENTYVVVVLGVNDKGEEYIERIAAYNEDVSKIKLPTYKDEIQKKRADLINNLKSAEQREDYKEAFFVGEKMLEDNLCTPDAAFSDMLKSYIKAKRSNLDHDSLKEMKQVFEGYDYLLAENLRRVIQMQLAYLQGDYETARKNANIIIHESSQYKAEILLQAKSVISGVRQFPKDELECWIINSDNKGLVGTIDAFDSNTDTGRISVDTKQYMFYWKDIKQLKIDDKYNLSEKYFDFNNYRYIVSFDEKSENVSQDGVARAVKIDIEGVLPMRISSVKKTLMGDDFDAELETINKLPGNELLKLKLQQYSLDEIKEYLSPEEQERIQNGIYQGIPRKRIDIVKALDNLHDKNERDEKYFLKAINSIDKSKLLLSIAKIIAQYLQSDDHEKFGHREELDNNAMNRRLYEYAYDYIAGYYTDAGKRNIPAGEMAYYAASIISASSWSKEYKERVAKMCIARYYQDEWTESWEQSGQNPEKFSEFLYNNCTDVVGLFRMILSFNEDIFDELIRLPQYEGMIKVLWENVEKVQEISGDSPKRQLENFYDGWNKIKQYYTNISITGSVRKDAKMFLDILDETGTDFKSYLFDEENKVIDCLREELEELLDNTDNESPMVQHIKCSEIYCELTKLLNMINKSPTKFSYESLRPFISTIRENIAGYIEKMYQDYAPVLSVEHYSLTEGNTKEVLCLTNAKGKLRAEKIHIEISANDNNSGFTIDKKEKQIPEFDFKADPGEAIEIIVPIEKMPLNVLQEEICVQVSYRCLSKFDRETGKGIWQDVKQPLRYHITIPLCNDSKYLIQKHENPYHKYAGGTAMEPKDKDMFFGRDEIIETIFREVMCEDLISVNRGRMTAFYGQKRSGKTSIMNFLKARIENANPKAIVLTINAQSVSADENKKELYMQNIMGLIFSSFKKCVNNPKYKALRMELKNSKLEFPDKKDFVGNPNADITFLEFFGEYNEEFGDEYPIVIMVDEFTQVYVNLKEKKIKSDFVNQWRALVTESKFANVLVGQDFMPKFFEDISIAQAVNGLAITSMYEIGYLDRNEAYKMMEKPIVMENGCSRFQGALGEKAKEKIFSLTGGSAFYLMKFMSGLVEYMKEYSYSLITPSLVDKVVEDYIFVAKVNPIEKKEFDPIFNEYSSSLVLRDKPKDTHTLQGQEEIAKRVFELFKEIARCILKRDDGVCSINDIVWDDTTERDDIITTLCDRRILVDKNGNDIIGKEINGLEFKVKVGLFIEFLNKRVLNHEH
ncbi:hypothetical protein [Selenomonas sp. FC4001]|uniref:nSTAND1 domain-containing NTPase n=1 Tax=Selenomonas sp. FC4001 TaxID=1408313 RepID=UPI000559EA82|nr:hypothetical protein [Selenomonas sp. FC4001]